MDARSAPCTVRISGRVQGVGFRAWTEQRANALGLSGWVRNCANGEVEAVFSGPAEAVERCSPPAARGRASREVERGASSVGDGGRAWRSGPFTIRADR